MWEYYRRWSYLKILLFSKINSIPETLPNSQDPYYFLHTLLNEHFIDSLVYYDILNLKFIGFFSGSSRDRV